MDDYDAPPAAGSILLDDLAYLGEPAVRAAIASLGRRAFAQTDEELDDRRYPVPELIKEGMFQAALEAIESGLGAWSRDACHDAAADILADRRQEAQLKELLRRHPPKLDNPWRAAGLDKLWVACVEKKLFSAMDELANLSPPPAEAWRAAGSATAGFQAMEALAARCGDGSRLAPCALAELASSSLNARAFAKVAALPELDRSKMASPWMAAARAADEESLRHMVELGIPAQGWAPDPRVDIGSPWGALAMAKHLPSWRVDGCAQCLEDAGIIPATMDLNEALRRQEPAFERLADRLERLGAAPDERSPSLCMRPTDQKARGQRATAIKEPTERLLRWTREGDVDAVAALLQADRASMGWSAWPRHFFASRLEPAPGRERESALSLLEALAASKSWDASDLPKVRAVFSANGNYGEAARDFLAAAEALGADPASMVDSSWGIVVENLAAWWDRAIIELAAPAPAPAPARSMPARARL